MIGKSTLFLVYAIIYLIVGVAALVLWQFSIHILWDWVYIVFVITMLGLSILSFYMYYGRGIFFDKKNIVIRNFKSRNIPYSQIECVDAYIREKKIGKHITDYDFRIYTKDGDMIYLTELGDTFLILESFRTRMASKVIMHDYPIMFVRAKRRRQ